MKITTLVLAVAALAGCSEPRERSDNRASLPPAVESTSSDPAEVRSAFLARLRLLAERGDLFEPYSVEPMLGMNLQSSTTPAAHGPEDCGDGTTSRGWVTMVTPREPSWFRALPSGAGHIEVPAFTINPATTTGDPEVQYQIYESMHCADWPAMRDQKAATLWFVGLPAFACLTPANIQADIPEARLEMATDGVSQVIFQGRTDDDSAVRLTFGFRAGAACALSAELRQDRESGLRYRRAVYKYEMCRAPSDWEFCSEHPDITWSDRELVGRMYKQAYERCGTLNSYYVAEPATGEIPSPLPRKTRRSPCEATVEASR